MEDADTSGYSRIATRESDSSLILQADQGNTQTGSEIVFMVDGTEHMRVNNLGRLGIGTTTPSAPLEVSGAVMATSFVGDGSSLTGLAAPTGVSGAIQLSDGSGSLVTDSNLFWSESNSRLGIGTNSPEAHRRQVLCVYKGTAAKQF